MVKEVFGLSEFESEIKGPGLVVVDFFTTWCGPCKQIAPFIDSLALKYPEVKFIKVDIEKNEDIAAPRRISSIPTFHFYVGGALKDEMKGANPSALESKVVSLKIETNPFQGSGVKLSNQDPNVPAMSAREARLLAFGSIEGPKKEASKTAGDAMEVVDPQEEEAMKKAMKVSVAGAGATTSSTSSASEKAKREDAADLAAAEAEILAMDKLESEKTPEYTTAPENEWEEEMVPVPVNEEILNQMLEMGFPDVRARKSIVHGGNLEGAMTWIAEHQDDADIDQPYMVKKSDTIPKPPLSEEEKLARIQAIKDRVKTRRLEREKEEKAEAIRREKDRRQRGQKMDETLEERQKLQQKRENEKLKKEKQDALKERQRLRAEIARDKEIRKANKGVLPSVLGVEGYNPSIVQYDKDTGAATSETSTTNENTKMDVAPTPSSKPVEPTKKPVSKPSKPSSTAVESNLTPTQKVDTAIQTLMRYRTGGDGGNALKLLLTFIRNVAEHPDEPKYRSINMESNAFKSKLSPLVGSVALLKAVGFQKVDDEAKLKYEGDLPSELVTTTMNKLIAAEAMYKKMNP